MDIKILEDIYNLSQNISYYNKKYNAFSIGDIKNKLGKTNKDFSYIFSDIENNNITSIITKLKQEDIEDFSKALLLLKKENGEKISNKNFQIILEDIIKDIKNIQSLTQDINSKKQGYEELIIYFSKKIEDILKQKLRKKEKDISEQELEKLLFNEFQNEIDIDTELEELADMFAYFQVTRRFYTTYGYVLTHKENILIADILEDLEKGRIVTLLGETGSGKTELARFISKAYLKKDPIVLSGSRFLTDEDFTLEKIITSKSILDSGELKKGNNSGMSQEDFLKEIAKETFDNILKTKEFKKYLKKYTKNDKSLKKEIENIDPLKYNLFTEYHLVGIFKAMVEGRPLILDEANLIKPEVLMALNDYLTRKIGDTPIELPNGLGKIKIQKGYNIIFTGNDPDAYNNKERYTEGRYKFDNALYNRLSVYQKDYYNQTNKKFNNDTDIEDKFSYLDNNQLYNILLMMFFEHKDNLFGIEFKKDDFEGKNSKTNKKMIFGDLYKLALATSMVQKAYAGEVINLTKINTDISVHNDIKRKVITMRNLKDILEDWKNSKYSLEYHIYKNFIQKEGNKKEQYALFAIFKEVGFFENLIGDDMSQNTELLESWYKQHRGKNLSDMGKEDKEIKSSHIEYKVLINKYDLLKELFGKDEFLKIDEEKIENIFKKIQIEKDNSNDIGEQTENISIEEKIELLNIIITLFGTKYNDISKNLIKDYQKKLDILNKDEKFKNITTKLHQAQENNSENKEQLLTVFKEFISKKIKTTDEALIEKEKVSLVLGYFEHIGFEGLSENEINQIHKCFEKTIAELN